MAPEQVKQAGGVGLPVGEKIDKYEIREKLGVGGQAIVYKCYDAKLDRFVAIKQISSHLAEDPKFLERFRKEAQILAKLGAEQPAIVTIHDLVEEQRGLFIVMEYVEGHTLETILRQSDGPIQPKAVLQVLWRLAAALHVVHQAGIIHRDIKPGNIIIGEGLKAKITDFGVAASTSGQTSMILGTTRYMAPELFAGGTIDGRADMYSLGFITYEMLIGRNAFNEIFQDVVRDRHSEALRWMKWHGNEKVTAPPAHEVDPTVPRALSEIVSKMTAKNAAARFENMEALGRAIKMAFSTRARQAGIARGAPPRAIPVAQPPGRGPAAAAVVAVLDEGEGQAVMGGDEADELDIGAGGAATAPIPKAAMSMRTKIFLLGVVLVTALALGTMWGVRWYQRGRALQADATQRFDQAWQTYEQGQTQADYEKALAGFVALRDDRFKATIERKKAYPMIPICNLHLAILRGKWDKAQYWLEDPKEGAKEWIKRTKRVQDPQLRKWIEDAQLDNKVDVLYQNLNFDWEWEETLAGVRKAVDAKEYDTAMRDLRRKLSMPGVTDEKKQEGQALLVKIGRTKVRGVLTAIIAKADAAADTFRERIKRAFDEEAESRFDMALSGYEAALEQLESDDAGVLEKQERDALIKRVKGAKLALSSTNEHLTVVAKMREAMRHKEWGKALELAQQVQQMRPSDTIAKTINDLKTSVEFDGIKTLIREGTTKGAIAKLKTFTAANPTHTVAKTMLDNLLKDENRQQLVLQADDLFNKRNWAAALEKLQKIPQSEPRHQKMIRECQFNLELAKADALYAEKKYPPALQAYNELMRKFPEFAARIEPKVVALQALMQLEATLRMAEDQIQRKLYSEARVTLKKITPETTESKRLWHLTYYHQELEKGQAAMDRRDWGAAIGHLKIAKQHAQTVESAKKIGDLLNEAQKAHQLQLDSKGNE